MHLKVRGQVKAAQCQQAAWRHGVRLGVPRPGSRPSPVCQAMTQAKVHTSSATDEAEGLPGSAVPIPRQDTLGDADAEDTLPAVNESANDTWEVVEGACEPDMEADAAPPGSHLAASGYARASAPAVATTASHSPSGSRLIAIGSVNDDGEDFMIGEDEDDADALETLLPAKAAVPPAVPRVASSELGQAREPRKLQFGLLLEAARRREPEEPDYSLEAESYERSSSRPKSVGVPRTGGSRSDTASSSSSSAASSMQSAYQQQRLLPSVAASRSSSGSGLVSAVRRREPEEDYSNEVASVPRSSSSVLAASARRREPEEDYSSEAAYEYISKRSRESGGSSQWESAASQLRPAAASRSMDEEGDAGSGAGRGYGSSYGRSGDDDGMGSGLDGSSSNGSGMGLSPGQPTLAAPPELMEQIRMLQTSLESIRQAQLEAEARAERAEQHARDAHSALQQAQEVSNTMVQHYNTLRQELEVFRERHMAAAPRSPPSPQPGPSTSSSTSMTFSGSSSSSSTGSSLRISNRSPAAAAMPRTPNPVRGASPARVTRSPAPREGEEEDERDEQLLLLQLELDETSARLDRALRDLRAHQLVLVAQHELSLHLSGLPSNVAHYIYEQVDSGAAPVLGDGGSGSVHLVKIPSTLQGQEGEQQWMEVAVKVVPLYDINTTRAYHLRDICPVFLRPRTPHLDVPMASFLRMKPPAPGADVKPVRVPRGEEGEEEEGESCYFLYTVWPRRHMDVDQLLTTRQLQPGEILTIMHHVVLAVHDLHAARMVHADIKPPNILVMLDQEGLVRSAHLTDFGSVQYVAASSEAAPAIWDGQLAWNWPPEQRDLVFLNGCDAWGLAMLYSCMRVTNPTKPEIAEVLQDESTSQAAFDRVRDKELLPDSPHDPPEIRTLTRLMRRCIIRNPLKRPSLQELTHTTQALLTAWQKFRQ